MGLKIKSNFDNVNEELYFQGLKNGIDSTNLKFDPKDVTKIVKCIFSKSSTRKKKTTTRRSSKISS